MEVYSLPGNLTEPKAMRTGSKHSLSGPLGMLMRVAPFINHWSSLYPRGWHPKSDEYCQLSLFTFTFTHAHICVHRAQIHVPVCALPAPTHTNSILEPRSQLKHIHLNHVLYNKEFGRSLFLGPGKEPLILGIPRLVHGGLFHNT